VYAELGQRSEALSTVNEALQDAKQERDAAGVVFCLSQLAELYRQQGDLESALRTFRNGLAWIGQIDYAPLVKAEIQKDLGTFYAQLGDLEQSTQTLRRCLELEGPRSDPVSLDARGVLATVMLHQGRLKEAIAENTQAIQIARTFELKHQEIELLLKRATVSKLRSPAATRNSIPNHPELAGIALSMLNRQGAAQNGVFWLKDIYSLHLPVSLVVLSGCRTSGLDDDPGEGLNSLAHAFFFSGARSVVGTMWTVDNEATSRLIKTLLLQPAPGAPTLGRSIARGTTRITRRSANEFPSLMGRIRLEWMAYNLPH
jgi:tetratricopeptide (TPR) repeat protein